MVSDEDIEKIISENKIHPTAQTISKLYTVYKKNLIQGELKQVDLSLLQSLALEHIQKHPELSKNFRYIIVDEYQDTNRIQERIFLELAKYSKNLCVVGDDDQSLYRFRGASVQNLVNFKNRVQKEFSIHSIQQENLKTNYRSRAKIVELYKEFLKQCNWKKEDGNGYYRVQDKDILAYSKDKEVAYLKTDELSRDKATKQIAEFVKLLVDKKLVDNPNQIAFLYSRFKANTIVKKQKKALEKLGLNVYAPRAGRFFDAEEPRVLINLFLEIFDKPTPSFDKEFAKFLHNPKTDKEILKQVKSDPIIRTILETKRSEIEEVIKDWNILEQLCKKENIDIEELYNPDVHEKKLLAANLSANAKEVIKRFNDKTNPSFKDKTVRYIISSASALDWNVLDLFYQLTRGEYFVSKFQCVENGDNPNYDEGPVWNLSIFAKYLSKFYEFVPSRDQTRLFGVLVHQTIEDIHRLIIANRKKERATKKF